MVAALRRRGSLTPDLEAAFSAVDRADFLPFARSDEAYSLQPLITQTDGAGVPTSTSSDPEIMADMLGALRLSEGTRVLEVGTGTGYNAALLAHVTGAECVTTVEVDPELADRAAENLERAGFGGVDVVCGDGKRGFAPNSPYDRVIVTHAAGDVAPAWLEQTRAGGVVLLPWESPIGAQVLARMVVGEDGAADGGVITPCVFLPDRAAARRRLSDSEKSRFLLSLDSSYTEWALHCESDGRVSVGRQ